jgi:hypothetical protein
MAGDWSRHTAVQTRASQKISAWHAGCNTHGHVQFEMTASIHHLRRAGACSQQAQQRCVVPMRSVFSVWNKKTGTGDQN